MIHRIDETIPINELPTWLQELWELDSPLARRAEKHYLELNQVKNIAYEPVLPTVFKTDIVVFFEMDEDCKFYDINGTEVTTEELMKHSHFIQDQKGYMILNGG